MDLPSTPSPNPAPAVRRRKKRSTPTSSVPGSSLSGLIRNSIRIVELLRGSMGYGFTISGQKPCLLRCIVEGSPAERAGLRPGNCLVGVNGKDVSHLAHDDVVALIGTCTGLLRLHVAESYFSESSDDESFQINQTRPKYHHRPRAVSKTALSKKATQSSNGRSTQESQTSETSSMKPVKSNQRSPEPIIRNISPTLRRSSWDPLMPSPRRASKQHFLFDDESPIPAIPSRNLKVTNPSVEMVRVFAHLDNPNTNLSSKAKFVAASTSVEFSGNNCDRFNTQSSSGSSSRANNAMKICNGNPSPRSTSRLGAESGDKLSSIYQAVVGYVGSIELPEIEERKRLQALSACVRRLRVERRMRSIVLLRIQANGISLFSSSQNVQTEPPLAFYSSSIISFCGAYSDDRRFFGLVTCTSPNKNSSCHVFMVEPKLLSHLEHLRRARSFGIQCSVLPVPNSGQVLGLQECSEFPATADPILSSILQLHRPGDELLVQRSPSEASTRLESTNSSNSDSGIGFRDDSDRNSARIYDIVEPELLFDIKNIRRSPIPRRKYPVSHKKGNMLVLSPCHSSSSGRQKKLDLLESLSREIGFSKPLNYSYNDRKTDYEKLSEFESDPHSLREILCSEKSCINSIADRRSSRHHPTDRLSLSSFNQPNVPPHHIEVSVLVTPPRVREKRSSMEQMTPISPGHSDRDSNVRVSLSRIGTRSLDNLCSPEIFVEPNLEPKGTIGLSTPALNQESIKSDAGEDFWEFKVPQPPKPRMEVNRVELWAESIEKLLGDSSGLDVFTEFLQHEFAAENILFYNACLRFKEAFANLTQSQRISMASTMFQRYLQNGATDPVNVDFQARCQVEKLLPQPTAEIFDLPLSQVFNLLKFDCYPRFLRSEMYRDYSTGVTPLPQCGDATDSDQDSVKSHKLHQDGRRRSLLPWNIRNRSKKSSKNKAGDCDGLNSDISFIQRTAMNQKPDSSDTDDGSRRESFKLCRVILPDNSTTVLPCKPGETLSIVIQRILEKREFHYSAFEVISVPTGKAIDLTQEVTEMTAREIRVEPRAFVGIELPRGWRVGVRANPNRKVAEVLKPILSQHSLKLDAVSVYDIETGELVDAKWPMGRVDGHNLHVKIKDFKLEEITNNVQEGAQYDTAYLDDDEVSTKTGSSHSSSVFRGFLRRSSKKYKRKGKNQNTDKCSNESSSTVSQDQTGVEQVKTKSGTSPVSDDENCNPVLPLRFKTPFTPTPDSPLSLVSSELSLAENSRNRKPIYIAQSIEKSES